jgi:hypothetical protein
MKHQIEAKSLNDGIFWDKIMALGDGVCSKVVDTLKSACCKPRIHCCFPFQKLDRMVRIQPRAGRNCVTSQWRTIWWIWWRVVWGSTTSLPEYPHDLQH